MNYEIEDIESIEKIGNFEDEYVYDVEINDSNHTFFANDILVHNSTYINFEPVMDSGDHDYEFNDEGIRQFILDIYEYGLKDFFEKAFNKYAEKRGVPNHLQFELESIAKSGIWLAKKKYLQDIIWKDGIKYDSGTKIVPKGVEIVQSSTPKFAREKLKELSRYLFKKDPDEKVLIRKLIQLKKEFKVADIDDIAFGRSLSDYEKYVLEDNKKIELAKRCPVQTRGAAIYNHAIKNSDYFDKYELIKSGDKIKYYYAEAADEDYNAFSYFQNDFPIEVAPSVDYDKQFEKAILKPLNRIVLSVGLNPIRTDLIYTNNLW